MEIKKKKYKVNLLTSLPTFLNLFFLCSVSMQKKKKKMRMKEMGRGHGETRRVSNRKCNYLTHLNLFNICIYGEK